MTYLPEDSDFMRLRISRTFEKDLQELGGLLSHTAPSQTVSYLLTRHLTDEILKAREFIRGRKDEDNR